MAYRGERTFDDVRGAQILPVLGRGSRRRRAAHRDSRSDTLDRLLVIDAPGLDEGVEGRNRVLLGLSHHAVCVRTREGCIIH
jgi:hypothetical protein